jgi:hypothetical protein
MATREATCSCGQLRLEAASDPMRISICHCLACQRRTGSAFGVQARFTPDQVRVVGRHADYARTSDEEDRKVHVFHFCPDCGATVFYTEPTEPDLVAVPVGAFADPSFPPPTVSIYESRRHPWVGLPPEIETDEAWESLLPFYEAGQYDEVADRGREVIAAHPQHAQLMYNVACCESLAGRTEDAIEHLRGAIDLDEDMRTAAADDSDFDAIREESGFKDLVG